MGVSKKEISSCPIDVTLSVIDGRWKGTILWRLLDGPMRTNELRKCIPEITERMLLRHLRDMTGAGILERHQEQGLPLRVRYSLTPDGRTLVPVLDVLCSWCREHSKRIRERDLPRSTNSPGKAMDSGNVNRIGQNGLLVDIINFSRSRLPLRLRSIHGDH